MLRKRARFDGAEQGERAEGFVQRRRRWAGTKIPEQIVGSYCEAVMTIVPEWLAEQATKPSISCFYNDADTDNDGKISNNDGKIPKADTDGDTIEDGKEDTNKNGRIDGDNGDGILTNTESWEETDPNSIDTDSDGIEDNDELTWDYNPCSNDTDHDGLADNIEDANKNGIRESTETNPILFDTDQDGLSDKLELDGWVVAIILEATGEEVEHRTVTSNPLLVDTDSDQLSDLEEFQNSTDPTESDSDGDGLSDYYELNNNVSSSPTGIDGKPPEIKEFDCWYEEEYGIFEVLDIPSKLKLHISVTVADIFGIKFVMVNIKHLMPRISYANNVTSYSTQFEWDINGIDNIKRALWDGFSINVSAQDRNGNIGWKVQEQQGIVKLIMYYFIGELKIIANKIEHVFSLMYSWIIESAKYTFNNIIKPVVKTIYEYICSIYISLDNFILTADRFVNNKEEKDDSILISLFTFIYSIFSPFINLFQSLIDVILSVINFLKGFSDYVFSLVKKGITEVINLLLNIVKIDDVPEIIPNLIMAYLTGTMIDFISEELVPIVLNPILEKIGEFLGKTLFSFLEETKAISGPEGTGPRQSPVLNGIKSLLDSIGELIFGNSKLILFISETSVDFIALLFEITAFQKLLKSTPESISKDSSIVNKIGNKLTRSSEYFVKIFNKLQPILNKIFSGVGLALSIFSFLFNIFKEMVKPISKITRTIIEIFTLITGAIGALLEIKSHPIIMGISLVFTILNAISLAREFGVGI